jgi:hypothetical protein
VKRREFITLLGGAAFAWPRAARAQQGERMRLVGILAPISADTPGAKAFYARLWGAPHIHGELLKLGFAVAQSTVAKYMAKKGDPSGQSWGTFLRNHAPHIAAMDLFVVPTIGFIQLYVLVHCPAGSAGACLNQCDSAPDGRMDRAADY